MQRLNLPLFLTHKAISSRPKIIGKVSIKLHSFVKVYIYNNQPCLRTCYNYSKIICRESVHFLFFGDDRHKRLQSRINPSRPRSEFDLRQKKNKNKIKEIRRRHLQKITKADEKAGIRSQLWIVTEKLNSKTPPPPKKN